MVKAAHPRDSRILRGMWRALFFVLLVLTAACGGAQPTASPSAVAPAPSAVAPSPTVAGLDADAAAPAAPATAAAEPKEASSESAPAAPPPPVERTGKTWPFHTWTRAVAVTFNQFPMRHDAPLLAYDDKGWSPHVVDRKPVSEQLANRAIEIVKAHEGDVAVSKCPFPRHAVVLYDGDVPVASINVCFECGDIMLWPRWSPAPDWDHMTSKQMKAHMAREEKHLKLYESVFPRWQAYFRDEVGFPIDAKYH